MADLTLSKTLDPADFDLLTEELTIVDRYFTSAREQHPMRRWEYALALRAYAAWGGKATHDCVDVGGAGSPFWRMLSVDNVSIVDPECGQDLAAYLSANPRPRLADAVFCLSVLEHVEDLDRFLFHLGCLVAPGGLLFLTMDYCDGDGPLPLEWPVDTYHFHWMRKRIFNRLWLQRVRAVFDRLQFRLLGDADWGYHGPQLFGSYTFASLALIKRS